MVIKELTKKKNYLLTFEKYFQRKATPLLVVTKNVNKSVALFAESISV